MEFNNLSISVIILTHNEELHIKRCILSAKKYAENIYVIDSHSSDKTVEIAKSLNVNVLENKFENYSKQFNWALENIKSDSEWLLRLDADEYLEENLIIEIREKLPKLNKNISGINFKRKHIFMNKWIKYGGRYPLTLLRMWKRNHGKIEDRWMDEHIILQKGEIITFKNDFCDHNLKNLSFFVNKHNWYASREALDIILDELKIKNNKNELLKNKTSDSALFKRIAKEKIYNRLPIGIRPFIYFIIRYIFLLGFLDGKKGLIYHFLQAFWYRFLVDCKVYEYRNEIKNINNYDEKLEVISKLSGLNLK
tara:strand:+ start:4612 stop:5538 length:927 start_codon:yes stop_codon:yes gene_type:complete